MCMVVSYQKAIGASKNMLKTKCNLVCSVSSFSFMFMQCVSSSTRFSLLYVSCVALCSLLLLSVGFPVLAWYEIEGDEYAQVHALFISFLLFIFKSVKFLNGL